MTVAIPSNGTTTNLPVLDSLNGEQPIAMGTYQVFAIDQPMLDIRLRADGNGAWNLPIEMVRRYREALMQVAVAHEVIVAALRRTGQVVPYGVPDTYPMPPSDIDLNAPAPTEDVQFEEDGRGGYRVVPSEPVPVYHQTTDANIIPKTCSVHYHFKADLYPLEYECWGDPNSAECKDRGISSGPCSLVFHHDGDCEILLAVEGTESCPGGAADANAISEGDAGWVWGNCPTCGMLITVDDEYVVDPHTRFAPESLLGLKDGTAVTAFQNVHTEEHEPNPTATVEELRGEGVVFVNPMHDDSVANQAKQLVINAVHAAFSKPWSGVEGLEAFPNLYMRQIDVQPFIPAWTGEGRLIVEVIEVDGRNSDDRYYEHRAVAAQRQLVINDAHDAGLTVEEVEAEAFPPKPPAMRSAAPIKGNPAPMPRQGKKDSAAKKAN